jgi:hypothetical protein
MQEQALQDILSLILPFFSIPKNYGQSLKKIAGFAFYEGYIITFFLRGIPIINTAFRSVEHYGALGAALAATIPHYDVLNIAGFAIALLVALISHVFQFHDLISDAIGIRRRFDPNAILFPLAELVGTHLTDAQKNNIRANRDSLMHDLFYRYASSRDKNSLVDKHDIEHAIAAWSWFWVFLEGTVYCGVATAVSIYFRASGLEKGFAVALIVYVGLAIIQRRRLPRYARPQIEKIASDHTAAVDIRQKLDAL